MTNHDPFGNEACSHTRRVNASSVREQDVTLRLDDGRVVASPRREPACSDACLRRVSLQGTRAEFPAVVVSLLTNHAPLLSRSLLYTAVDPSTADGSARWATQDVSAGGARLETDDAIDSACEVAG